MTYAKVIADSVTPAGDRLTTFEVRFHRFVLAEFNTHRVFSRNSASSRAIPVKKQIASVRNDPAWPLSWPAEQSGMQGGDELSEDDIEALREDWQYLIEEATNMAEIMSNHRLHKSVVNRVLEPFMWHTVVVTATAWENFFALRRNPMAQPEIRAAAELMKTAYDASVPRFIHGGQYHLPYISTEDAALARYDWGYLAKVSAARCARVSYLTQDGRRDMAADLELYERLTSAWPMHASPLEHVARPAEDNKHDVLIDVWGGTKILTLPRYGNLLGWHQLRFDVEAAKDYQAFA